MWFHGSVDLLLKLLLELLRCCCSFMYFIMKRAPIYKRIGLRCFGGAARTWILGGSFQAFPRSSKAGLPRKASQDVPKAFQGVPKASQGGPRASQGAPKASPRRSQRIPQGVPKGFQGFL